MSELKTRPRTASVDAFVADIEDDQKRADSAALVRVLAELTGAEPVLWGSSMVGFGQYHYRYASGHEGDTFEIGFAPRKQALTIYVPGGLDSYVQLLARLGKHTVGKGCLYLKRLSDADPSVLRQLLETALRQHRAQAARH